MTVDGRLAPTLWYPFPVEGVNIITTGNIRKEQASSGKLNSKGNSYYVFLMTSNIMDR